MLTKPELQNLTNTHLQWLHYFQIRSRLSQQDVMDNLQKKEKAQFEQLIALEDFLTRHKLSMIYQILLDLETKMNLTNITS